MKLEKLLYLIRLAIDEYLSEVNYQAEIVNPEPKAVTATPETVDIEPKQKRRSHTRSKGDYPRSYEDMTLFCFPTHVRLTIGSDFSAENGIETPNKGTIRVDEYGNLYLCVGKSERYDLFPSKSTGRSAVQCPKKMVMPIINYFGLEEGKYALNYKPTAKPLTWQITGFRHLKKRNEE